MWVSLLCFKVFIFHLKKMEGWFAVCPGWCVLYGNVRWHWDADDRWVSHGSIVHDLSLIHI